MFNDLKYLLQKNIKKAGISRQVEATLVLERFNRVAADVFDERILQKIKPLHLKDKVITVACLSSVVAQELKLNEIKIIKEINSYFNKEVVERLRFMV